MEIPSNNEGVKSTADGWNDRQALNRKEFERRTFQQGELFGGWLETRVESNERRERVKWKREATLAVSSSPLAGRRKARGSEREDDQSSVEVVGEKAHTGGHTD